MIIMIVAKWWFSVSIVSIAGVLWLGELSHHSLLFLNLHCLPILLGYNQSLSHLLCGLHSPRMYPQWFELVFVSFWHAPSCFECFFMPRHLSVTLSPHIETTKPAMLPGCSLDDSAFWGLFYSAGRKCFATNLYAWHADCSWPIMASRCIEPWQKYQYLTWAPNYTSSSVEMQLSHCFHI